MHQMSLRMILPTRHPRTGLYHMRLAIPAHLRDATKALYGNRHELIVNLKTRDPKTAKALAPAAQARLRAMIERAEKVATEAPKEPSRRGVAELVGDWYRRRVGAQHADRALRHLHEEITLELAESPEFAQELPEAVVTELAQGLLRYHDYAVTEEGVTRVVTALQRGFQDYRAFVQRRLDGNWSDDDPALVRYPAPVQSTTAAPVGARCTMDDLLSGWAADQGYSMSAQPMPRALYDRLRTVERLASFLGHRDAAAVTKADAVRTKEDMQARGLHASTVRNDLGELRVIWRWGLRHGKLSGENPWDNISPPKAKRRARAVRAFTQAEALMILEAARRERGSLRWLPWVLCLTGARVSEIAQMAVEDVTVADGVTVFRVTDEGEGDEARSVKTEASRRVIPVHPALAGEGLLDYVSSLPPRSSLWPDLRPANMFASRGVTASKRMGQWLRKLGLKDPALSPAHSWRHWFVDACRATQMHPEVRSALTGHSAKRDESAGYGAGMGSFVKVLAENIAKVRAPLP
jgi:integrase